MGLQAERSPVVLREMTSLLRSGTTNGLDEAQLLQRFATQRDEAAFRVLVERHGPRVLGVCRSVLRDQDSADDAFQATFLVLARRAGSIGRPDRLGGWLRGVARRVSHKARASAMIRAKHERLAAVPEPASQRAPEADELELVALLEMELDRLPERYRRPIELCCLEGRSTDEAARELGWPRGTVGTCVARGRERLRQKLEQRGYSWSLALGCLTARLSPALLRSTLKSADAVASALAFGASFQCAHVSSTVISLAQETLRSMIMKKIATIGLALLFAFGGVGVLTHRALAGKGGGFAGMSSSRTSRTPLDDKQAIQGTWVVMKWKMGGVQDDIAEGMVGSEWIFKGDQFRIELPGIPASNSKFVIDSAAKPKTLVVTTEAKDQPERIQFAAIYTLEADTLRLAFLGGSNEPPKSFDAPSKAAQPLIVVELESKANAPELTPEQVKKRTAAITKAREAASRAVSTNNLKQIVLAMHNYADAYGAGFPAQAICDKNGKPLLSWRVAILPFIDQSELYQQFHLDEAWDSPHNKTLVEKMPRTYAPVGTAAEGAAKGTTFYQVFVGGGALFETAKPRGIPSITDGTSSTILAVEASEAVPWSAPIDLNFDPDKELPKVGGTLFEDGFCTAFADGSVKFLKANIDERTLRKLITAAGGEVIAAE